ncbi:PepSY-like domain-containing protein [Puia dinghuensis]|uniref:Putative beta-lactamase-inhibitor-like PepSY-like domain-containing protein n=1 Tax=Puia dinghuensis TaxID=1792502 RepID=A0A8J2UCB6_9BACT|nr:PepSY-like domain-containing protein [Puia dinghuensis]GGA97938.1 hypothetical protein GCM10011511_21590 [Puia dinghuensis]
MNRLFIPGLVALCLSSAPAIAQKVKSADVPAAVKSALMKKYPAATHIIWEKEKGNFEANWGGRSNEDNSVAFTPDGTFVEQVVAIPVGSLPPAVAAYVKQHYPGAKITEAGKVTDAAGKTSYEAEVKGKDLVFDTDGNFLKVD